MTSQEDLAARIRALPGAGRETRIDRIRAVIDEIDNAISRGVRRADLLQELNRGEQGPKMTMASFASTLKRVRQQRKASGEGSIKLQSGTTSIHRGTQKTQAEASSAGKQSMADFLAPPVRRRKE